MRSPENLLNSVIFYYLRNLLKFVNRPEKGALKTMRYRHLSILFSCTVVAAITLLAACGEPADKKIGEEETPKKKEPKASTVIQVGNEHFSIPSPIQTSVLIKNSGANFDKEL